MYRSHMNTYQRGGTSQGIIIPIYPKFASSIFGIFHDKSILTQHRYEVTILKYVIGKNLSVKSDEILPY